MATPQHIAFASKWAQYLGVPAHALVNQRLPIDTHTDGYPVIGGVWWYCYGGDADQRSEMMRQSLESECSFHGTCDDPPEL